MTDLQISLIVIGIAIVIGVFAYNKWQEYRAKKHVERAFSDPVDDVLMKTGHSEKNMERREPVLNDVATLEGGAERAENNDSQELSQKEIEDQPIIAKIQDIPIDDRIELPIMLNIEESLRGEKMLPHFQSLRHAGSKPVRFLGMPDGVDLSEDSWQTIVPGNSYRHLKVCVQLANRSGALNEIEYSELLTQLRQIADAIDAEPDIPEMVDVIEKARQLYQFVSDHDAKLGISIRSNRDPWQVVTLKTALEKQGFKSRPDGLFVMKDQENSSILFSLLTNELVTSETVTRLTLLMDVPCIAQEKNAFGQMVQCGKALCIRLDGSLVDDGNQLLTDDLLNEIAGQVDDFYKEMEAVSIPAGSVRALRLFR